MEVARSWKSAVQYIRERETPPPHPCMHNTHEKPPKTLHNKAQSIPYSSELWNPQPCSTDDTTNIVLYYDWFELANQIAQFQVDK